MTKETQLCALTNWSPAQNPTDTHELLLLSLGEAQPWFSVHSLCLRGFWTLRRVQIIKGLYLNFTRKFSHKVVLFLFFK